MYDEIQELKPIADETMESIHDRAYDDYLRLSGEAMARETQNRMDKSPEWRAENVPDWDGILDPIVTRRGNLFESGGSLPWNMTSKGDGDFYIQRVGPNAGKVSKTRNGPSDIAFSTDQDVLLPDYAYYAVMNLEKQLQARAHGTAQQAINKKDIDDVLTDFFNKQQGSSSNKDDGVLGQVGKDKFNKSKTDASEIFGDGAERIRYTDPDSGGTIEVVTKKDGSASVLELIVPEEFRGKGVGQALQKQVMDDFPKMGGQVSSKAAAKTAYRLGRRPIGSPDATLDDVFNIIDENSSVNLVSKESQIGGLLGQTPAKSLYHTADELGKEALKYDDINEFVTKVYKRQSTQKHAIRSSIAKDLGGEYSGNVEVPEGIANSIGDRGSRISVDGNDVYFHISVEKDIGGNNVIFLPNIAVVGKNQGLGTKFMNAMKNFSDKTSQDIVIYKVTNDDFFRKFDWLEETELGGTFKYKAKKGNESLGLGQLDDIWKKAHKSNPVTDGVLGQKPISNADKEWFKPSAYKNVNKDNIVYLTPQEFLDFASPISNKKALTGKKANVDKLVKDGTQFDDLPYLQISDKSGLLYNVKKGQARVTGHDGRHRVMALAEQGVEKIPVVLKGNIDKAKLKKLISQNGKATSNFPGYAPSNKGKAIVGGVLGAVVSSDSEQTTEPMTSLMSNIKAPTKFTPSNDLLDFVKNFENAPLAQSKNGTSKAYKDYDTTSQGFGSEPKKDGSPMTKEEADKAVIVQLIKANKAVDRLVKVDLNEHQRNALVSMLSNVKTAKFAKSNALKALNNGNIKTFLKEAFDPKIGFVKAGGKISNGLVRRRAREKMIFTKGNYGN
jgi:GH24 family phage-related lysozyme (muramidase)/predicted GNAT family acetyltransferase